jgi:hypothetical protein
MGDRSRRVSILVRACKGRFDPSQIATTPLLGLWKLTLTLNGAMTARRQEFCFYRLTNI